MRIWNPSTFVLHLLLEPQQYWRISELHLVKFPIHSIRIHIHHPASLHLVSPRGWVWLLKIPTAIKLWPPHTSTTCNQIATWTLLFLLFHLLFLLPSLFLVDVMSNFHLLMHLFLWTFHFHAYFLKYNFTPVYLIIIFYFSHYHFFKFICFKLLLQFPPFLTPRFCLHINCHPLLLNLLHYHTLLKTSDILFSSVFTPSLL